MRIHVHDVLEVTVDGQRIPVEARFAFEGGADSDVAGILQAVGEKLGAPSTPDAPLDWLGPARVEAPRAQSTRVAGNEFQWERPDMHGKAVKSVHRVVDALARANRGLTVQEVSQKARIGLVPVYQMIKDHNPQGRYAAQFLQVTKIGRGQVIDLTRDGRQLASLIRAGEVPA